MKKNLIWILLAALITASCPVALAAEEKAPVKSRFSFFGKDKKKAETTAKKAKESARLTPKTVKRSDMPISTQLYANDEGGGGGVSSVAVARVEQPVRNPNANSVIVRPPFRNPNAGGGAIVRPVQNPNARVAAAPARPVRRNG